MGWSIKLFTLGGTAVRMHLTFLLLLAWIAAVQWTRGTPQDAISGVLFIIVLFGCVVLHEFGHIWAARRYGIRTPDVTLLPIGGVAKMERMPEKPSQEIAVALAGPAVNAAIALVLIAVLGLRFDPEPVSLAALQSTLATGVMNEGTYHRNFARSRHGCPRSGAEHQRPVAGCPKRLSVCR